jgi:hypothetical protein
LSECDCLGELGLFFFNQQDLYVSASALQLYGNTPTFSDMR